MKTKHKTVKLSSLADLSTITQPEPVTASICLYGTYEPTFTRSGGIREQIQARKDQPYYLSPMPLLPLEEAINEIRKFTGTVQTIPISNFKGTIQVPDL